MPPAFNLRNIALVNFYLYGQDFPLSGLGNTVFLGANGSGKSVLLDAIQIVMTGMNKRFLDLNSRVSEGGKSTRTVNEACLGLLDDGDGYERESCITYIALGFEAADGSRCTAGVCLEAKASMSEETVLGLFIAEGEILPFQEFVEENGRSYKEKGWQQFLDEQRRKKREIHVFQRQKNRAFLRHLYSIINANRRGTQLDPDRARAAMRQALSFDIGQIASVTDFVKRFLLDDFPIEVETFQSRYATWRKMQQDIARIEAEIEYVEQIRSFCSRVMQNQFDQRYWDYGLHRAEYDRLKQVISHQHKEVSTLENELESTEAYKASLDRSLELTRAQLAFLEQQIKGVPGYEQLKLAQSALERAQAFRRAHSSEAKPIFHALIALRRSALTRALTAETFPAVVAFAEKALGEEHVGPSSVDWPSAPREIQKLVTHTPDLSPALAHVDAAYRAVLSERSRIARDLEDADTQIKKLRAGGTYMSKDTENLLADLREARVPAKTVSEVTEVRESFAEWRGIVEAVLGDWVDAIIVAPSHMDVAYAIFDSHYKGTRAKLVQSENVAKSDQTVREGTLAEVITTEDPYARAFLNVRLGRIARARSAADIRRGDLAASPDGKYAHGRGIEYRRLPPFPRLGKTVREQQIENLSQRARSLRAEQTAIEEKEIRTRGSLEDLRQAKDRLNDRRDQAVSLLRVIEQDDDEIAQQAELVSQLSAELPKDLLEEQQWLSEEFDRIRKELRETGSTEKELVGKVERAKAVHDGNVELQQAAAEKALAAFPSLALRRRRHPSPIGQQSFVRRARANYRSELAVLSYPAQLRNHFEAMARDEKRTHRSNETRLITLIENYVHSNPDHHPGVEWTKALAAEQTSVLYDWISLRHRHLTETVLRNFKDQVDKAVQALVETMVHDFLSRLRANIVAVDQVKEDLNRALRRSVFMNEVYQIRQERDQDKEIIRYLIDRLDIVAPKATALMQSNPDPNDPDQIKIKELIDMLTVDGAADDAAHKRRMRELADYRNYFRFSIDICDPSGGNKKISDLERRRGKASGGQKFVPFYICLGVAAAAAYRNHLGDAPDAPPQSALLLMDEAFEKLDPENVYKIINFYKELGLQLLMAAPKTHQAIYQETFDTLVSIVRVGRAIQATPQHFHPPAHALLRAENPMHKPRRYFEELARKEGKNAAE